MKLGFALPQIGALASRENMISGARQAEDLGFDSVWVLDRVMSPEHPKVPYPASIDGSLPEGFKRNLDPLETLSFVAAITERVTLGTSILNLPYYSPVLLARQVASLDVLSAGRVRLGLGVGWSPDEYEAVGTPFSNRGKRADEAIQVMKTIWGPDPVSFDGEYYKLAKSVIGLKPIQQPHPPVYMAAFSEPAMRRVALYGDGWVPTGIPLDGMEQMFGGIKAMAAEAGRDADTLELQVRANVYLSDEPLGDDRFIFSGNIEQVIQDTIAAEGIGATELLFDVQFSPGVDSIEDYLSVMKLLHSASTAAL